jgi:hypothetical protein
MKYTATLEHDQGEVNISVHARSKKQAISLICISEKCPESAITKMVKWVGKGKVVPVIIKES